jgi:hypothetical protein
MDRQALQSAVGTGLTAADYRGMTADQVRQTQQIGMQQFGMMAQVIDAMQGRQLQREQMAQMERQYEAQREMAQKQFELMQRQEVREQISQAFNMFATKASHHLERKRLQLDEQLKTQQMSLTGLQIKQIQQEMKESEAIQDYLERLDTSLPLGGGTAPTGFILKHPAALEMYKAELQARQSTESALPAKEQEILSIARDIMTASKGRVPLEVAKIDARIFQSMKDIPSPTDFVRIVAEAPMLMRLLRDEEAVIQFWQRLTKPVTTEMTRILMGESENAREYSRLYQDVEPPNFDVEEELAALADAEAAIAEIAARVPDMTRDQILDLIKMETGQDMRANLERIRRRIGSVKPQTGSSLRMPIER